MMTNTCLQCADVTRDVHILRTPVTAAFTFDESEHMV